MNDYKQEKIKIKKIVRVNENLKIFTFSPGNNSFNPGQFFMLDIPGFSEAPFTPTNFPDKKDIEFLIQRKEKGIFTEKLFKLKKNDNLLIRGPYGNGFPFEKMKDKNISLIAGGCGLAPIKSALEYLYRKKSYFGQIQLFYGTNTPEDMAYNKSLAKMKNKIEIITTVSKASKSYRGNIGFVDKLIDKNTIKKNSIAILCGPEIMYKNIIKKLIPLGLNPEDIYLQYERRMHCGIGKCQHCTCGDKYVCTDGPVFTYKQILKTNTNI